MIHPRDFICCDCGHQAIAHKEGKCGWAECKCQGLLAGLSKREFEVLRAFACGATVKEVASRLFISVNTVEAHKYNIFRKTGAESIIELVLAAVGSRVINIEELPKLRARVRISLESPPARRAYCLTT